MVAQFLYIDDVNINLTSVAFASRPIFTPSTFWSAIQARSSRPTSGIQPRHRVPVTSPQPPNPPTGSARGRFFTSRNRPQVATNNSRPFTGGVANSSTRLALRPLMSQAENDELLPHRFRAGGCLA